MKNRLEMGETLLDNLYQVKSFDSHHIEAGIITAKDKFLAAKQILLGLGILYMFTIAAYLIRSLQSGKLLDICTTIFPPLATLILVAYFREKQ